MALLISRELGSKRRLHSVEDLDHFVDVAVDLERIAQHVSVVLALLIKSGNFAEFC